MEGIRHILKSVRTHVGGKLTEKTRKTLRPLPKCCGLLTVLSFKEVFPELGGRGYLDFCLSFKAAIAAIFAGVSKMCILTHPPLCWGGLTAKLVP